MNRTDAIRILKQHETELTALGIARLSLFGSTARDQAGDDSDLDIVVTLEPRPHGFAYFGKLDEIEKLVSRLISTNVDVLAEPVREPGLRRAIERDKVDVF